jgi:DNA-binding NarL/FixJ family response regulator
VASQNADGDAVLTALTAPPTEISSSLGGLRPDDVAPLQTLKKRESRVLVLLGQGMDFREIAGRLSIASTP